MCPNQLTAAIAAAAVALGEGRSAGELSLLGAVLTQLGDTLATMAAQKSLCEERKK